MTVPITIAGTLRGATGGAVQSQILLDEKGRVTIKAGGTDEIRLHVRSIRVPGPGEGGMRALLLPDGSVFETADADGVDALIRLRAARGSSFLDGLIESQWHYALISLAIIALGGWLVVTTLLPFAARKAAEHLPESVAKTVGAESLRSLDQGVFAPSNLDANRRAVIQARFAKIAAYAKGPDLPPLTLVFRRGNAVGPNAFALPDGSIVMTDELVELSRDPDELAAVLAHEAGHVVNRHGMRMVVQDSILTLALLLFAGDVFSASSLAVALPAMLLKNGYSRDFEREADRYALRYMRDSRIDPGRMSAILKRMTEKTGADGTPSLLSTHPSYEEREKIFMEK